MYYIPRKTKVRTEFMPGVTWPDVVIGLIVLALFVLLLTSNFAYHFVAAIIWLAFGVVLFLPLADGQKMYITVLLMFRFLAYTKKYSKKKQRGYEDMSKLIPYQGFIDDKIIDYGTYYGMVLEIKPVEFLLLNEEKQNAYVSSFKNALMRLNVGQDASIVKINKAILMDDYIADDEKKYESMLRMQLKGEISEDEVETRTVIFQTRVAKMLEQNDVNKQYADCYYLVVYDRDKSALVDTIEGIASSLASGQTPIRSKICVGKELGVFLKANYSKTFDEREAENKSSISLLDWVTPEKVEFKTGYTKVDGEEYRCFNITDYPLTVYNGWLFPITSIPNSKVVVNLSPIARLDAEKMLDKAIVEMEAKASYSKKTSKQIENATHLQTLRQVLGDIKNSNESLFNVNIHISCEEYMKKEMRALLKESGYKYTEMFGRQVDSFVSANISRLDNCKDNMRGINTTPLSACFPFISSAMSDQGGFYIGYNNQGNVIINFFRRDSERVNSNMMIIGKSGGGKSFATKDLLCNMAGDNSKIFVLDPEYEYAILSSNLCGKVIDVGSGLQGRINPFHITPSLVDEEDDGAAKQEDYAGHLQFLEQYFRVILDGMDSDSFEKVNSLVIDMYKQKGIDGSTDLTKLKPEDFPIFDDLYNIVLDRVSKEKDEYLRRMYQIIQTYIQKFATGGRNANLWNGPTTLETKQNFVVFSFRSLLANQNKVLANAQMLLVLRYLNNEIIKNKEFNAMMGFKESDPDRRKVIVAVDEAHVFIDAKYPIALDFMQTLAKRIRKYDGMQIIITQNIKDFVGSAEIAKQSTAIINASQFTMVLSLAPNDMTDLVELYRNAGGINEDEQQTIVQANRGEAFLITSPLSRTFLKIEAYDTVRDMFEKKNYTKAMLEKLHEDKLEAERLSAKLAEAEKEKQAEQEREQQEQERKFEEELHADDQAVDDNEANDTDKDGSDSTNVNPTGDDSQQD